MGLTEARARAAGYPVRVEAPDLCPVFATRTVVGFDPEAPSPRWLARRVALAGMRPISLAVDVTVHVQRRAGCILHAFNVKEGQTRLCLVGLSPQSWRQSSHGSRFVTVSGGVNLAPDSTLEFHRLLIAFQRRDLTNGQAQCVGCADL